MASLSDIARMNDMVVERKLYMDTDSEEQISIDDESGNLPPHQEPFSGSEDSVDKKHVEPEDGTREATNVGAVLSFSVPPPVLAIPNIKFSSMCVESSINGSTFMNID
jgi:hypothetical protein